MQLLSHFLHLNSFDFKGQWQLKVEWSSERAEAYNRDWVYSADLTADPA